MFKNSFLALIQDFARWLPFRRSRYPLVVADILRPDPRLLDRLDSTPDRPVSFGYKMCWLAVRSTVSIEVRDALRMDDAKAANWQSGIHAAYLGYTFVSPSVKDWVFVLGFQLPELTRCPGDPAWNSIMRTLSERFGEVQYFGTHRVSEYHAWGRFVDGQEHRAFAYCEGILCDRGEKTSGEIELGYRYFDDRSPEAQTESYWDRSDLTYPDETHVMEVAGKWSIDPQTLEELELPNTTAPLFGTYQA